MHVIFEITVIKEIQLLLRIFNIILQEQFVEQEKALAMP